MFSFFITTTIVSVVVTVTVDSYGNAVQAKEPDKQWDVTCSYSEVYNELIFDLLQDNSPPLDLRLIHLHMLVTAHGFIS